MSGLLGKADLQIATNNLIYTVPAGKVATVNINCCNYTTNSCALDIIILSEGEPLSNADFIERGTSVPGLSVLERTGIAMSAGEKLWVWAENGQVSVRAHGFEEDL